jgi:hypothetical protein
VGGAPWTPAKLPNINKWFDAHDITTITTDESNRVSEWRSACNNLSATAYKQENLANAPTYDAAKQALIFNGRAALGRVHEIPTGNVNVTWVYIYKRTGMFSGTPYLLSHDGTNIRVYSASSSTIFLRSNASLVLNVVDAVIKDDFRMLSINYINNGNSIINGYYHGGTVESPTDVTITGSAGTNQFVAAQPIILGANAISGGLGFVGEIKAVISVVGTIGASDMLLLKQFARDYYGAAI